MRFIDPRRATFLRAVGGDRRTAIASGCGLAILALGAAAADLPVTPDEKTSAAVLRVDKQWADAEEAGDAAYVDWLLEPSYRTVDSDGKPADKASLLSRLRARTGLQRQPAKERAERQARLATWEATHPRRGEASIIGDTAIVTWVSTKMGEASPIYSCDVFVYRLGHWHAAYSQHTAA